MKSRCLIILSYTFVLLFWACADSFKETEIKLVLTGSVHGQLDPCGWKKNPLGGLSRKYVKIKEMREHGENPIILDAGDMFSVQPVLIIIILNQKNIDARQC